MKDDKSNTKPNIYQRVLAVMADVSYIVKTEKSVNKMYSFIAHDAVTAAIHPALVKHGVTIIPDCVDIQTNGNRVEVMVNYKFVNVDDPSDSFSVNFPGHGVCNQDKAIGKALSYSYKYCLLKTFCLEGGEDNERLLIDHVEEKISESQLEELDGLLWNRTDMLDKILTKCPQNKLENLQAKRFQAVKSWIVSEIDKEKK